MRAARAVMGGMEVMGVMGVMGIMGVMGGEDFIKTPLLIVKIVNC